MSLTVVFQITGQESGEKVVFFPNPFNGLNAIVIAGWRRHCDFYQPSMFHLNFRREITLWLMQQRSQERGVTAIGVAKAGAQGARAPPIKIPLTTKSYDNISWRCLVAVFFQ